MDIPGYDMYANREALELAQWALEEFQNGDRVKASKMKKIADKMEDKYRNSSEFKALEYSNRAARRTGDGVVIFHYTPLVRPESPKPQTPNPKLRKEREI